MKVYSVDTRRRGHKDKRSAPNPVVKQREKKVHNGTAYLYCTIYDPRKNGFSSCFPLPANTQDDLTQSRH